MIRKNSSARRVNVVGLFILLLVFFNSPVKANTLDSIKPSSVEVAASQSQQISFADRIAENPIALGMQLSDQSIMYRSRDSQKLGSTILVDSIPVTNPSSDKKSDEGDDIRYVLDVIVSFYFTHSILCNSILTFIYGFLCGSGMLFSRRK